MRVSAFITSLRATGAGAALAMTVRASFVSSDARSTASTGVSWPDGSPSSDASHRRTLRTISSCVSPSKDSDATGRGYRHHPVAGLGTAINVATILAGTGAGLLVGGRIPERARTTVLQSVGLITIALGVGQAIRTHNIVFPLVAIVVGGLLGEALRIEDRLE